MTTYNINIGPPPAGSPDAAPAGSSAPAGSAAPADGKPAGSPPSEAPQPSPGAPADGKPAGAPAGSSAPAGAPDSDPRIRAAESEAHATRAEVGAERQAAAATEARKQADRDARKSGRAPGGGAGKGAPKPMAGLKTLATANLRAANTITDKAAAAATKGAPAALGKAAMIGGRAIPFVGSVLAVGAAIDNFSDGDWVGGLINLTGVVPGAGQLVSLAASLAWETCGDVKPSLWDEPDGSTTFMLPGVAAGKDSVAEVDKQLTEANRAVFAFSDGPGLTNKAWSESPPDPLRLDSPAVKSAVTSYMTQIAAAFEAVDTAMAQSGEAYMLEFRARMQNHLAAMAELRAAPELIMKQLTASSDAAGAAWEAVRDANFDLRTQLAENNELSNSSPVATAQAALSTAAPQIEKADSTLGGMYAPAADAIAPAAPAPVPSPPLAPAAPAPQPGPAVPAPGAPGAAADGAKSEEKSDLAKLLESVGKPPAMPQVPSMGGTGNPLGGMGGGGNPLRGMGGGQPLGQGGGRKLDGDRDRDRDRGAEEKAEKKELKKPEEKKPLSTDAANAKANVPTAPAAPTPAGAPAGKPGEAAVKPADPIPAKPTGPTEVDVKGEKVEVGDPKIAKLLQLLAAATPGAPLSLADAAAAAGLTPPVPGQDLGQQVSPTAAVGGDVLVVGDRQFMLLGGGKFYDLAEYKVVGASELPSDAGPRGGYFHLGDPADPGSAPGGGAPVSPPTGGVAQDVPGGQPTPSVPVDAKVDAPEASTPPPSVGSPGVPAAGSGNGPANAAGTATGTGVPKPSTGGAPLDPAAVR